MPLKSNCNHIVFIMEGKQKKIRFVLKIHHFVLRLSNISFCGLYKIDVFLLTQWKNRLAVVRGIVERKNLLGYRMEWHEELHACLLSFLADELPTLGVLTDMVRVQFLYIYIG